MRTGPGSQLCQAHGNCLLAAPDAFELTGSAPSCSPSSRTPVMRCAPRPGKPS